MARENIIFPYPDSNFLDEKIPKGVLSPSGFNTHRKCPRQYMYAYVEQRINPPGISQVKGSAIHKGAEVVHKHTIEKGELLPLEAVTQSVSDSFDSESENISDWGETNKGTIKDDAITGIKVYYRDAVPMISPVAAEKPFAVRIGTVPVRGVIDLIDNIKDPWTLVEDPNNIPRIEVVADLKTASKLWPEQKIEYETQLTFYSIVENTPNVRVDFLVDRKAGVEYVPKRTLRSDREKQILIEDVEEVVFAIKAGIFPRCDPTSWVCTPQFCGYYKTCRGAK